MSAECVSVSAGSSSETTRRRVKLYMLNEERQWDDKGTGHVSAMCIGGSKSMGLVVISESDGSTLLESCILSDTAYQKQQETLIVWSETDNTDLALSFQEKAGCDEVWEKICNVQGKDPSVDITQEVVDDWDQTEEGEFDTTATTSGQVPPDIVPAELPPCDADHLPALSSVLQSGRDDIPRRESVVAGLVAADYLKQLMNVFREAEESRDRTALNSLFEIVRMMIYYNKHCLIDRLTSDDLIFDVVGILEYDPSREPKAQHREFLRNRAIFNEIVPFNNDDLTAKIHRTYRMQYILECCLPPCYIFEEHLVTLSSIIFFNKIEILTHIQNDAVFLRQLFSICENDVTVDRQMGAARLVKELCDLARMLQIDQREPFFKTLYAQGVYRAVAALLRRRDAPALNALGADVVSLLTEFTPNILREYQLKESEGMTESSGTGPLGVTENGAGDTRPQQHQQHQLLLNTLVDVMHADPDPELSTAMHITHTLRVLLDPENMTNNSLHGFRGERHEFLVFFYKFVIDHLLSPLFSCTTLDGRLVKDDYRSALMVQHLLEFLGHCVDTHSFHARTYIINNNILKRLCTLLHSKHLFLQLGAIRLLRRTLGVRDTSYVRYMVRHRLLSTVVDLFLRNGHRYNLVDSAIIEYFEFIRAEEIRPLINHLIEHHWSQLKDINYVGTFAEIKKSHGKFMRHRFTTPTSADDHPSGDESDSDGLDDRTVNPECPNERVRRDPRQLDKEEENWFEEEEEEEEEEGETEDGSATPPVIDDESEQRPEDESSPPPLRRSSSDEEEEEVGSSVFSAASSGRTRRPAGSHLGSASSSVVSSAAATSGTRSGAVAPQRYALNRVSSGGGAGGRRAPPIVINISLSAQRSRLRDNDSDSSDSDGGSGCSGSDSPDTARCDERPETTEADSDEGSEALAESAPVEESVSSVKDVVSDDDETVISHSDDVSGPFLFEDLEETKCDSTTPSSTSSSTDLGVERFNKVEDNFDSSSHSEESEVESGSHEDHSGAAGNDVNDDSEDRVGPSSDGSRITVPSQHGQLVNGVESSGSSPPPKRSHKAAFEGSADSQQQDLPAKLSREDHEESTAVAAAASAASIARA